MYSTQCTICVYAVYVCVHTVTAVSMHDESTRVDLDLLNLVDLYSCTRVEIHTKFSAAEGCVEPLVIKVQY